MAQITLNSSGVASNGSLLLQSNGTTTAVTIDTAQNMGLGVTPQAWNSDTRMIDVGASVSMGNAFGGPASLVYNAVQSTASSGAWKYRLVASVAAGLYTIDSAHKWFTAASGTAGNTISFTQAMTLDASGQLGIGETSPTAKLHISGANLDVGAFKVVSTTGTNAAAGAFTNTGGNAYIGLDNSTGSRISGSSGAGYSLNVWHVGAYPILFGTSNAERARIDSSGNLLVGATSQGTYASRMTLSTDSGTTKWSTGPYNTSTAFIIAANGTFGVYLPSTSATSWSSASDERVKTDLEPIENAIQKVSTLRAVTGRYKSDDNGVRKAFLIAQDVLAVLPEAVDTTDPEKYGLAYTDVIPLLVAAIKEQQAIITQLQADVAALKGTA